MNPDYGDDDYDDYDNDHDYDYDDHDYDDNDSCPFEDDHMREQWAVAGEEERRGMMVMQTGLLLLGARDMEDESLRSLIVPVLESMLQNQIAPRCEHCKCAADSSGRQQHYYSCRLAKKCPHCWWRTDLPDEPPHPDPCPRLLELEEFRKRELRERRERELQERRERGETTLTLSDFPIKVKKNQKWRKNKKARKASKAPKQ